MSNIAAASNAFLQKASHSSAALFDDDDGIESDGGASTATPSAGNTPRDVFASDISVRSSSFQSFQPREVQDLRLSRETSLVRAMHEAWKLVEVAKSSTSRREYQDLVQVGVLLGSGQSWADVLSRDILRSSSWVMSTHSGAVKTWPLQALDSDQLWKLRRLLTAFAARADQLISAGSSDVGAHYIQGWNYLARLLLFAARFDDFAAFCVFEGLMLTYGLASFSDVNREAVRWNEIFDRYDDWYGPQYGCFSATMAAPKGAVEAQLYFRTSFGAAVQMGCFAHGLPPLTAIHALSTVVAAGPAGADEQLAVLLTGVLARLVRLSGVPPGNVGQDTIDVVKMNIGRALETRGLSVKGQMRIARRLQQRTLKDKAIGAARRLFRKRV